MKFKNISLVILLLAMFSCRTKQQTNSQQNVINYMQNIEQVAIEASLKNSVNTVQVGDQLVILVSAKDLDVVKPFNQNYSSGELITQTMAGGNISQQSPVVAGPTYIVDSNGVIDFPVLGKIDTSGKTIEDVKAELQSKLKRYILNPTVSVRLANYKITVLGEVNKPGQYIVSDTNPTILNAIGLAGDLTLFGKRDDILIVRNVNGEIVKDRVNLTDASFINSAYYHLKQGDVIYVSANRNREIASKQNPNTPLYISVGSIALGLIGILVSVLKK